MEHGVYSIEHGASALALELALALALALASTSIRTSTQTTTTTTATATPTTTTQASKKNGLRNDCDNCEHDYAGKTVITSKDRKIYL